MKFKVGDRIISEKYDKGTIVKIDNEDFNFPYLIKYDLYGVDWPDIDEIYNSIRMCPQFKKEKDFDDYIEGIINE